MLERIFLLAVTAAMTIGVLIEFSTYVLQDGLHNGSVLSGLLLTIFSTSAVALGIVAMTKLVRDLLKG